MDHNLAPMSETLQCMMMPSSLLLSNIRMMIIMSNVRQFVFQNFFVRRSAVSKIETNTTRVVFTREKFLHFICSLPHGNHSDSNNPLTKMHMLTHIGHQKYNIRNSMKIHFKIQFDLSGNCVCIESAEFGSNMVFFCHLCHQIDQNLLDFS